jgi:hypothetical protein
MNSLLVSKRLPTASSAAQDVAQRLCDRMYYGKVVIIADEPKVFIAVLRKQWLKLARKMQVERASTLNPTKVAKLSGDVNYMLGLRFTTHYPPDEYLGDVYIVGPKEALAWPPQCSTMYIVAKTERHERYLLTSWMLPHSLVVLYEHSE